MSGYKPLAIDLSNKEASPEKFAADAAAVLKETDRVEIEPTATGLVLRAISELDADLAVDMLRKALGLHIECGNPLVLYRKAPRLLEPIMQIRLAVPEDCVGEVIADLNQRRGRVQGSETDNSGFCKIHALVPLANIFGYLVTLQQLTKGRGKLDVDYHGYEPVPPYEPDPDPSEPSAAALKAKRTA